MALVARLAVGRGQGAVVELADVGHDDLVWTQSARRRLPSSDGICDRATKGTVEDLRFSVKRSVGLDYRPVIGYPLRLVLTGPGRHRTHDEVQRLGPNDPKLEVHPGWDR